jgi:2-oxoglutarate dehydrogenase E2 component (dihydrolipoamide succinyltransferase)
MSDIIIPNFGESVTSATISTWNVESGARVNAGDVLVTLETDKVASELEAQENGILEILVPEGNDVGIGDVIGRNIRRDSPFSRCIQGSPTGTPPRSGRRKTRSRIHPCSRSLPPVTCGRNALLTHPHVPLEAYDCSKTR